MLLLFLLVNLIYIYCFPEVFTLLNDRMFDSNTRWPCSTSLHLFRGFLSHTIHLPICAIQVHFFNGY